MQIMDGKEVAASLRKQIASEVEALVAAGNRPPHLAAVLVGNDGASQTYVGHKEKCCGEVGFRSTVLRLPEETEFSAGSSATRPAHLSAGAARRIAPGLPGNPPARTVRNPSCKFPDRHLRSGPQPGSTFYPLTTGTPEKFRLHPTGHGVPFRHRPRPLSVTTPPRRGKPSLRISDRTA